MQPENYSNQQQIPTPKFRQNDIVWIYDERPYKSETIEWPTLFSKHEIDCKVISAEARKQNKKDFITPVTGEKEAVIVQEFVILYRLMSGHGIQILCEEKYLVTKEEKEKIIRNKLATKTLNTCTPLAPVGTLFVLKDGYWSNDSYGIYISEERMLKLKHIFS